jgi:hypothetical protein
MEQQTTVDQSVIIERIKKLLKHSESAKSLESLEEASVFLAKANELLLKHNLELSQIVINDDSDRFANWVYGESVSYQDNQSGSRWRVALLDLLTTHNMCSYTFNRASKTFRVCGYMSNVDAVIWMYHFTSNMLLKLAQKAHVEGKGDLMLQLIYGRDLSNRYAFLKDWLLGGVSGFEVKLDFEKRTRNSQTQALVVSNSKMLDKFIRKTNPAVKSASPVKRKSVTVGPAYNDGQKVGRNLDISKVLK